MGAFSGTTLRTLCALAPAILAVACNALIGTRDLVFDAQDGDAGDMPDVATIGPDTGRVDGGDAAGPCSDTSTNANHCGRCGHSCLGGSCNAGKCQPFALTTGISPRYIALDGTHVYWVDSLNAHVAQMNKDGTGKIDLALAGPSNNYPTGLAVDAANVFWGGTDGILFRCKIGGCANAPTAVAATTAFDDLVVDDTFVYWMEGSGPTRFVKAPKGATNANGTTVVSIGSSRRLAQDLTYLYTADDDGTIRRVTKADGTVTNVGKAAATGFALTVDDAKVYFGDGEDPASVNSTVKTGGGNGSPLAASQHHPASIAVDATSIYWANAFIGISSSSGSIMSCSFASCTPVALADTQHWPLSIAVDDMAIYWANFDGGNPGGSIMKLAKP